MAKNGSNRANVVFMPSGKRGSVEKGTTILKAAQELAVDLNSICGGRGRCSKCQVEPIFGEFSKLNLISKISKSSFLSNYLPMNLTIFWNINN